MIKINGYQKVFTLAFIAVVLLWGYIQITGSRNTTNYWYSFLFGLIPLFGGFIGIIKSDIWGRFRSVLGKAIFFFSLGLLLWGIGETIWSYYNFFKGEPAPYPSLADLGFAPSIFFWIVGTIFLARATGAFYSLKKSVWAKILAVAIPIPLIFVSYYLLINVARGGVLVPPGETPLKVLLDIAYPLGDFLALTFALVVFLLSNKYLGGHYRGAVACILLGLGIMYFGDFSFSYTTTTGTFYNANFGDLLLASGTFFMTVGILGFCTKPGSKSTQRLNPNI